MWIITYILLNQKAQNVSSLLLFLILFISNMDSNVSAPALFSFSLSDFVLLLADCCKLVITEGKIILGSRNVEM